MPACGVSATMAKKTLQTWSSVRAGVSLKRLYQARSAANQFRVLPSTVGVYKNAKPLDGSQIFQFDENFASDFCWYNLRNLDNEENGLNGVRFSYDWKTRSNPSTLKAGSKPEVTAAPSTTTDTPASTSATATSAPLASSKSSSRTPASSSPDASAGPTASAPGSSSAAQTGGGSQTTGGSDSSSAPPTRGSAGTDSITITTPRPTGQSGGLPLLNNSTLSLPANGTTGGASGSHGTAPPPLSSGVIAGIIIGAVLGVLGILGFLGALWLVKRRGKRTLARQSRVRQRESKGAAFATCPRFEADSKSLPMELCGDNKPGLVELPG